ncbi:MAG: hypothetical protein LBS79_11950 [Tannerella sp.]|jgi:TolB-like protein|nr:hypothetical protein [Tannerella sp.]
MQKKDTMFFVITLQVILNLLPIGCASNQSASNADELDSAIRETSNYLNENIPKGSKLAFLNFRSEYQALSEYVIDELISNTVNDKLFTVVDRANLALIQQEIDFQMSGEISDETAVSIGQMLGAQTIVSGTISQMGDLFRLRVRALDVQTAQIQGQFNRNIPSNTTITLLIKNPAIENPAVATTIAAPRANTSDSASKQTQTAAKYKIGDTGPAGGIIFYDKGNSIGGWRYLEAAPPETETKAIWAHERRIIDGVKDQRSVGLGKKNTQTIMETFNSKGGGFNTAARICVDLVLNGFDDWFLPSFDELSWMYGNLHQKGLGEFKNERYSYYWSSTQETSTATYVIDFSDGNLTKRDVIYTQYVRAIRQF